MIAGLPKAPSRYNPIINPSRAKIRRDWILSRMYELNMISRSEYEEAHGSILTAGYHGTQPDLAAPYIAEMARQKAVSLFGAEAYSSGLNVYVTASSELQNSAQQAVINGLDSYDLRHGYRGALAKIDTASELSDLQAKQTLRAYINKTRFTPALIKKVHTNQLKIFTLEGTHGVIDITDAERAAPFININKVGETPSDLSTAFAVGDIIEVSILDEPTAIAPPLNTALAINEEQPENSELNPNPAQEPVLNYRLEQSPAAQSALVSLRPKDGAILALSGGYNFRMSKYNRATQAKRQPGSNFKAFIYLAALEQGNTAATLINDAPLVFNDKNLETSWRPENSSGKFYGPTRLREALYRSRNLVSIRLLRKMGIKPTLKQVSKFGFNENDLPKDLSLALGSAGITPIDVAAGYAMIANGGHYIEPYLVSHITNSRGETVYKADPYIVCDSPCTNEAEAKRKNEPDNDADNDATNIKSAPRIADERAVFILHSMMKDVIRKGTGRRAQAMKRPDIGGKTGTTNDQKDAWFSGFNTEIATSVWTGFDNPSTLGRREYGSRAALPTWMEYMATALKDMPLANMAQPTGITSVKIDKTSGLRTNKASNSMFELFRKENIPDMQQSATPLNLDDSSDDLNRPEDIF